jgi:hypothetical protein
MSAKCPAEKILMSNGITFIPSFVKIGQLVQKIKMGGTYRQHGYLTSLLDFLFIKGK